MGKSTDSNVVLGQLVTYVWCTKAVTNTSKLGHWILLFVPRGDGRNPLWHRDISKSRVFALPSFVVEIRVASIVSVLTVLPYWVLRDY
jgi:hypothetical protein